MYSGFSLGKRSSKRDFSAAGIHDQIRCFKVGVSASSICEWNGNRIENNIPRDQICRIMLCGGTDVKIPFFRFLMGIILLPFGLIGSVATFFAVIGESHAIQFESGVFMLPLSPLALWFIAGIGFWLLVGVFRVRYFFLIETKKGTRKISFGKSADVDEIKRFISKAKKNFGYVIDISSLSPETHLE